MPLEVIAVKEKVTLAPGLTVTGGEKVKMVMVLIVEAVALCPPGDTAAVNVDSVEGAVTDRIREPIDCTCSVRFL